MLKLHVCMRSAEINMLRLFRPPYDERSSKKSSSLPGFVNNRPREILLNDLSSTSSKIGNDPLLAQGAGGNTSIKIRDLLWVKASGAWLADAGNEPIFVPVRLSGVRRRIAAGEIDPVTAEVADGGPPGLRPSIETTLHALLPHRVVVHVHCIRTLAWAVRRDGADRIAERLEGLRWAWVEYRRPGLPLTELVAGILAEHETDVLVLANHGLVIGAASCDAARSLLDEVTRRLDQSERPTPPADARQLAAIAEGFGYRLPLHEASHRVALDPVGLRIASAGSLYPDHVVFLGPALATLRDRAQLAQVSSLQRPPAAVAVPGAGLLVRKGLSRGGEEMLLAMGLLSVRVDDDGGVCYLPPEEEAKLLDWDAEKYRAAMARY